MNLSPGCNWLIRICVIESRVTDWTIRSYFFPVFKEPLKLAVSVGPESRNNVLNPRPIDGGEKFRAAARLVIFETPVSVLLCKANVMLGVFVLFM